MHTYQEQLVAKDSLTFGDQTCGPGVGGTQRRQLLREEPPGAPGDLLQPVMMVWNLNLLNDQRVLFSRFSQIRSDPTR